MAKLTTVGTEMTKKVRIPGIKGIELVSMHADALQKRFDQLGGSKFFGALEKKEGSIWYYKGGCLCYNAKLKKVFEIHGAIYEKWKKLGGKKWGIPNTDELTCPDRTGKFNHFNENTASIYWSPKSGANGIWGDIRKKWSSLGWERCYLGYPTSDEVNFPDGGRVNSFQGGGIYWWSDIGAIDLNNVAVQYKGLVCIKETGEISGSDEPYVLMGVLTPFGGKGYRSRTYGSVDSNTSRPDLLDLYTGKPNGISIDVILMENDHGDPEKHRKQVTAAFEKAHQLGTAALGFIPVVGIGIAAVLGPLIQHFVPQIGAAINNFLGLGDDQIGKQRITLTGKDMILIAKQGSSTYKNVSFKFSTNNLRGHNANYKVYFSIVPV